MLTPSRRSTSVQWIEHECQDIDVRQGSPFKRECQRLTVPMQPSWEAGGTLNSCHDCTIAPATLNIHRNTFQTDDVTLCAASFSYLLPKMVLLHSFSGPA